MYLHMYVITCIWGSPLQSTKVYPNMRATTAAEVDFTVENTVCFGKNAAVNSVNDFITFTLC